MSKSDESAMPLILSERRAHRGAGRYLLHSLLFLAVLTALGAVFRLPLTAAFLTNPYLNGAIAAVFLFGVAYTCLLYTSRCV